MPREAADRVSGRDLGLLPPDNTRASKAVVGILESEKAREPVEMRKWFSDTADLCTNRDTLEEILLFLDDRRVARVLTVDRLLGCPHEEGVDYPEGEACLECPNWRERDHWEGARLV